MGRNPVGYAPSLGDWGNALRRLFKKKKPYTINVDLKTETIKGKKWKFPSEPQIRMITRILNEPKFGTYAARQSKARVRFEDGYNKILDMDLLRKLRDGEKYDDFEADSLNSYREAFKRILNGAEYTVNFVTA